MKHTRDNVLRRIIAIIAEQLGTHPELVDVEHNIVTGRGADPLDQAAIIAAIEGEFGIVAPDAELQPLQTGQQLYDYLVTWLSDRGALAS